MKWPHIASWRPWRGSSSGARFEVTTTAQPSAVSASKSALSATADQGSRTFYLNGVILDVVL